MKIIRSDPDGERTYQFLKKQMAKFNLDKELLEALAELLNRGNKGIICIEASVREFMANDDALSTSSLHVFKHGGIVNDIDNRAVPFIEFTPAILKVLSSMRDILEMGIKNEKSNVGNNGQNA